jgi:hypothetical protein
MEDNLSESAIAKEPQDICTNIVLKNGSVEKQLLILN